MKKKQGQKKLIKNLIFEFLKYLEIVKNRSESTIRIYQNRLEVFFNWFAWSSPSKIDKEAIWKFRIYLSNKKLHKSTQAHYLIVLRMFFKFLKNKGIEVLDPSLIELPKLPERDVKILNEKELEQLLSISQDKSLKGLRDLAILETLFSTGLRVSELCSLNRDIDFEKGEIIVKGKGGKIRNVFLAERAKKAILEYLSMRRDNHPALFISLAKNLPPKRITPRAIQKIIKYYGQKAGILKNIHPHTLRHQLATILISEGANIRFVQELLGHKNISTTQIYTHIAKPELKEIYKKYFERKYKKL